ncbi:MAG: hypothetical protein GY795_47215 [Desulfobacterales bacterium]|nr:hypothetical protein [Desulfobacterales bacterium]
MMTDNSLPDTVEYLRFDIDRKIDSAKRSELGQFMTDMKVAGFMASLFDNIGDEVRLLDAGAAVGTLTASFVLEMCNRRKKPASVCLTAYEIDRIFSEYLGETLKKCAELCVFNEIEAKTEIIPDDFIGIFMAGNMLRTPVRHSGGRQCISLLTRGLLFTILTNRIGL